MFFDTEKKNRQNFWIGNFFFCQFGVIFGEPRPNGPQNQLPRQILLQIDLSRDLYVQKTSDSVKISALRFFSTQITSVRFSGGFFSTASYPIHFYTSTFLFFVFRSFFAIFAFVAARAGATAAWRGRLDRSARVGPSPRRTQKLKKEGGQASERPGVRTPGRPGVRASGHPSVRASGHPSVRASGRPSVRKSSKTSEILAIFFCCHLVGLTVKARP